MRIFEFGTHRFLSSILESQEVEVGEEVLAMAADLPLELATQATRLLEEHDFTNVLNHIPADAFNDLFTGKSGFRKRKKNEPNFSQILSSRIGRPFRERSGSHHRLLGKRPAKSPRQIFPETLSVNSRG